ncbi:MAG: ferric reductase-like transmembrane domain-containing protein [Solirubrobacterales bacterium]
MRLLDLNLFWLASRAAGTTALILASASVTVGLLCSYRVAWMRRLRLRPVHEALSIATLAMIAVHGVALLGDPWLKPGIAGVAVPFATPYAPFWTGLGVIAAYGLAALGLSYYARGRLGPARWRSAHRLTALFWLLGVVHTLGAGSDLGARWYTAMLAVTTSLPMALLAARLVATRSPRRDAPVAAATADPRG